jgi:hypothetical protein
MFEKKSEKSDLSELAWAQEQLRENVAPRGSVKERVRTAALRLGWSHSRTRTLWYADDRASVKPKELRRITELTGVEYGREELRSVDDLIAQADARLMGNDPDFHSAFAAALRTFIGAFHRARAGRTDD